MSYPQRFSSSSPYSVSQFDDFQGDQFGHGAQGVYYDARGYAGYENRGFGNQYYEGASSRYYEDYDGSTPVFAYSPEYGERFNQFGSPEEYGSYSSSFIDDSGYYYDQQGDYGSVVVESSSLSSGSSDVGYEERRLSLRKSRRSKKKDSDVAVNVHASVSSSSSDLSGKRSKVGSDSVRVKRNKRTKRKRRHDSTVNVSFSTSGSDKDGKESSKVGESYSSDSHYTEKRKNRKKRKNRDSHRRSYTVNISLSLSEEDHIGESKGSSQKKSKGSTNESKSPRKISKSTKRGKDRKRNHKRKSQKGKSSINGDKMPVKGTRDLIKDINDKVKVLENQITLIHGHPPSETSLQDIDIKLEQERNQLEIERLVEELEVKQKTIKKDLNDQIKITDDTKNQADEKIIEYGVFKRGMNVLFILDITQSMQPWIDECKAKIDNIRQTLYDRKKDCYDNITFGFIAYRDYDFKQYDQNNPELTVEQLPFTDDLDVIKEFLGNLVAIGGDDDAEDVSGALFRATKLTWDAKVRLIIHITDAPCHGEKYHTKEISDNFLDFDPSGVDIEATISEIGNRFDYYFCTLDSTKTGQMTDIFQEIYDSEEKRRIFEVKTDLMSGTDAFEYVVLNTIESSSSLEEGIIYDAYGIPTHQKY